MGIFSALPIRTPLVTFILALILGEFLAAGVSAQPPPPGEEVVIHSRDAEEDATEDLRQAEVPVIMHSFSGSIETATECINRGYFISIPTAIASRRKYRKIAKAIPLEHLLTETDSPYLSPFPDIKRNEPGNVIYAVKEIAKLKELDEEEVGRITLANAKKTFKILQ